VIHGTYLYIIKQQQKEKDMTYAQIQQAKSAHETAAKLIRYSGISAKCIKNNACEQPYQVDTKTSVEQCKELQTMLENMLKYPVNVVSVI